MLRKSLAVVGVLLFLSLAAECAPSKATPTYVSTFETAVRDLLMPITNLVGEIRDGFLDLIMPGKKDSGDSVPKTIAQILEPIKDKLRAIYPGTRWCGDGDTADDHDDLGLFYRTDACCRAHDNCKGGIPAGKTSYNLKNNGIFTRSPCECDMTFYKCLKAARSPIATKIGTTYFNVLRPQCFETAPPIKKCKSYYRNILLHGKCAEYEFEHGKPEKPQWFDSPDFL